MVSILFDWPKRLFASEGTRSLSPLNRGWIIFLFVTGLIYALTRSVFVAFAHYGFLEKVLAVLFLLCEFFVLGHSFGYFLSVYRIHQAAQTRFKTAALPVADLPAVAILVPARHEPKEILETTLLCLYNLDYPRKQLYLLDDSSEESFQREAREIAAKYAAQLFRRDRRHGAKAGIINDCLKTLSEPYVAIFDVDQNPIPSFLNKLLPVLEADPKLAFVQTPQFYTNGTGSLVAHAANIQQAVFYEYVCEAKSSREAMICCGTNVVLRRQALRDVGGLDESTVTEDFATSIKFHLKGWKSMYLNHVYTFGMGPRNLGGYLRQQHRWAMGNVAVLKSVVIEFLKGPWRLRPVQWLEYLLTASYYLIGWAYLFLMLCPVIFIFFSIPSFFMNPVVYAAAFAPYYILSTLIFLDAMRLRHYPAAEVVRAQLLLFLSLPVYLGASLRALSGRESSFVVTAKTGDSRIPYGALWPQLVLWAINIIALSWGVNRFFDEPTSAVFMNIVWIAFHTVLLSSVFYFNED